MNSLNEAITQYCKNTESAEANVNLALEYEQIGQVAAASMYFLRAAELFDVPERVYECLIKFSQCYSLNRGSDVTLFGMLAHAITICPKRPEAYYYYCKYLRENGLYVNSYMYSRTALDICTFDDKPLNWVTYPGKQAILLENETTSLVRENNYIKRFELNRN